MGANTAVSQRWIIPYDELVLGRQIGAGSFGEVHKGTWRGLDVAIKRLFRQHASDTLLLELRKESVIMSQLRHPNILLFIGACVVPPNLAIVTEYMKRGSVRSLLRNKYDCSACAGNQCASPDVSALRAGRFICRTLRASAWRVAWPSVWRTFTAQVRRSSTGACCRRYGSTVLTCHVCRDLSSYNILVDKNFTVKIGDFGLTRIKADNATY